MNELINKAKATIPTVDSILEETWKGLKVNKKLVTYKFGQILVNMDIKATEIFRYYEKMALLELAREWLKKQKEDVRKRLEKIVIKKGWDDFVQEASQLFAEFGTLVQAIEKILVTCGRREAEKLLRK